MSNLQLESSSVTENERIEELVDSLPPFFPKHEDSTNYQIYGAIVDELDDTSEDIIRLQKSTRVTEAETIPELEQHGKLVDTIPFRDEGIEHYRKRVLAGYQNITSEGTIEDLLSNSAYILEISQDRLDYIESDEPGLVILGIPASAIESTQLETEELADILEQILAADYRLTSIVTGTFQHMSHDDWLDNNHNEDYGYSGLDEDGNIKEVGGTYSTTLN